MSTLKRLDTGILSLIGLVLILTVGIYFYSTDFFALSFAAEDGVVEYATALLLFVASLVLVSNAVSLRRTGRILGFALTLFYALLFFFAAGEEISWGQRIFGWESSEFFKEKNFQEETNIHNLIVGEKQLTKTLFGPILTTVLLLYLVVLPLLYPVSKIIRTLSDAMAVPVPGKRHAILALAASIVIAVISVDRKWEVYELVFSLLAVSIFLLPQNRDATK